MDKRLTFLIFPALVCLASPVAASEWWFVSSSGRSNEETAYFVENSSLKVISNNHRTAWGYMVLENANSSGIRTYRELVDYNCSEETYALVTATYFGNNERYISSYSAPSYSRTSQYAAPDTMADGILKFVCSGPQSASINLTPLNLAPLEFAARFFKLK